MNYTIKQVDKFKYIEEGEGEPLILLHGLFGALSNFGDLINYFKNHNKVVVPILLCLIWTFCIPQLEACRSLYISS